MANNLPIRICIACLICLFIIPVGCTKKEGCTDPVAENFDASAQKDNNSCISQRNKFIGVYNGVNQCNTLGNSNSIAEVRASNENLKDIVIYNLGGRFVTPVKAEVNKDKFTIYPQPPFVYNEQLTGTGTITGNIITVQYTFRHDNIQELCFYTMQK